MKVSIKIHKLSKEDAEEKKEHFIFSIQRSEVWFSVRTNECIIKQSILKLLQQHAPLAVKEKDYSIKDYCERGNMTLVAQAVTVHNKDMFNILSLTLPDNIEIETLTIFGDETEQ